MVKITNKFIFSTACVLLLGGFIENVSGQEADTSITAVQRIKLLRSAYQNKTVWDKIFSAPGHILYFPFKILLKGVKSSIVLIDESRVIPQVQDFLNSDDGKRGAQPIYASKIGAGIKIFQRGLINPESKLSLSLTAGFKMRQNYQFEFKRVNLFRRTVFASFKTYYQLLSTESFFGIGANTVKADRSNYAHEMAVGEGMVSLRLNQKSELKSNFGLEVNNILPGKDEDDPSLSDIYNSNLLSGLDTQIRLAKFILEINYDTKNRSGNPSSGFNAIFASGVYRQIDDDEFGFWKFNIDVIHYFHLFYQRVLVLRFASELSRPFPNREVPFFHLSELGPEETIRGFKRGRFHDLDYILGSAEYRYPVSKNIDALLFVDAGQVSSDILEKYTNNHLEVSFGGGFRVWGNDGLKTKLEIGKSKDGYRIIFSLN